MPHEIFQAVDLLSDSPYRNALSTAVLRLQETGQLAQMKRKWWKEKRGGGQCEVSFYFLSSKVTKYTRQFSDQTKKIQIRKILET